MIAILSQLCQSRKARDDSLVLVMAKRRNGSEKSSQYFTAEDVSKHNTEDDCWVTDNGKVYDVTSFLSKHPGGADFILSNAGRDVTDILGDENTHVHTSSAYNLLRDYKIGKLVGNNNVSIICLFYTSCSSFFVSN